MPLTLNNPAPLLACSLEELRLVVRAVPQWTEVHARQLDQVLRSRIVEALTDSCDSEALLALQRAVLTMVPHAAHATLRSLQRDWIARWGAWADLLDTRVAQLDARAPGRVRYLRHVPELLTTISEHHGLTQRELAERTGLSSPNISRLLRILEDHELIIRRREGTAKRVYPAEAQAHVAVTAANQPLASRAHFDDIALRNALQARGRKLQPMTAPLGDPVQPAA